jgi:hypothetical protein
MHLKTSSRFILLLLLSACATQPSIKIPVVLSENQTLDFTGKGAAAGIMLDAVMGGAGIAIGIAIDKGIAKDIAKNLDTHKPIFNVVDVVERQLKVALENSKYKAAQYRFQNTAVTIEHYGFKTVSGGDDLVSAWLELSVLKDGRKTLVRFPEDVDLVESKTLASVKNNSELAYTMLIHAAEKVVDVALSQPAPSM